MKYFKDISETELKSKKERTLRAAWIISLLGPLATAVVFLLGRTNVLLADLFRRSSELLALFLSWIVFRKVERGSNVRYNYGYHRLEDIASFLVGMVMIISFVVVFYNSLGRLLDPDPSGWLIPGVILSGLGFLVNGWFWQRNYRLNHRESTPVFESQWRLYRVKTLIDFGVVLTLSFEIYMGSGMLAIYVDFLVSVLIAGFLLISGGFMVKDALMALADRAPLDVEEIFSELQNLNDQFSSLQEIRCRSAGGLIFIDIQVEFAADQKIDKIKQVEKKITDRLQDRFSNLEVQVIPVDKTDNNSQEKDCKL